jgi:hypothetical protein
LYIAEIDEHLITRNILYKISFRKRREVCGLGREEFAGSLIVRSAAAAYLH